MLVKDLIYLLQTRAAANDEVYIGGYISRPDRVVEVGCALGDNGFDTVEIAPDSMCKILIDNEQFENLTNQIVGVTAK